MKLTGDMMIFKDQYLESDNPKNRATIKHSVTMTGLLAPLFGFIIGRKIKLHLESAMKDLSK